MRTIHIALLLTAALSTAGCSKKPKPAAPAATPSAPATTDPAADASGRGGKQEVAEGDVRDTILALRRVHFALDSSELTSSARTALEQAADKLAKLPKVHLYVQGHTDERGTSEYNVALGERRAKAIVDYLSRLGVAGERLHIISYGEERPLASGHQMSAWAKNRRVDFQLMRGDIRFVLEEGELLDDGGHPMADGATSR